MKLDPLRIAREAGRISEEILVHLADLPGADSSVTLEIHVKVPGGISDDVVRVVSENAAVLKFEHAGFEDYVETPGKRRGRRAQQPPRDGAGPVGGGAPGGGAVMGILVRLDEPCVRCGGKLQYGTLQYDQFACEKCGKEEALCASCARDRSCPACGEGPMRNSAERVEEAYGKGVLF